MQCRNVALGVCIALALLAVPAHGQTQGVPAGDFVFAPPQGWERGPDRKDALAVVLAPDRVGRIVARRGALPLDRLAAEHESELRRTLTNLRIRVRRQEWRDEFSLLYLHYEARHEGTPVDVQALIMEREETRCILTATTPRDPGRRSFDLAREALWSLRPAASTARRGPVRVGKLPYTLAAPPNWRVKEKASRGAAFQCIAPRETGQIEVRRDDRGLSLEQMAADYEKQVRKVLPKLREVERRKVVVAGAPALYRRYEADSGGAGVDAQGVFVVVGQDHLILNALTARAMRDPLFKPAQAALLSLSPVGGVARGTDKPKRVGENGGGTDGTRPIDPDTIRAARAAYLSAYRELRALLRAGKGHTPEARRAYRRYRGLQERYNRLLQEQVGEQ